MINSVQPDSPIKISSGELPTPITSNAMGDAAKQNVSQNSVQQNVKTAEIKSNEVDGQIDTTGIDSQLAGTNSQLQKLQSSLSFEKDEDSERMIIFVKDKETGETIRQIPTEEFLAISSSISQYLDMSKQSSDKNSPLVGMFTNETV
ncbi:hypothetical protein JCM30760_08490 [Thiomicrorhabdus hydrogeniphila]